LHLIQRIDDSTRAVCYGETIDYNKMNLPPSIQSLIQTCIFLCCLDTTFDHE